MKTQTLGNNGPQASAPGLGCMSRSHGTQDDLKSMATIHRALDLVLNFLDIADVFRFPGTLIGIVILASLVGWSPQADAYPNYDNGGQGCIQCHSLGGGDARQFSEGVHEGFCTASPVCGLCHVDPANGGGDPSTYASALGQGCRGCHGVNNGTNYTWGVGLRLHHRNAGVSADAKGKYCLSCHTHDPAPSPESTLPVYYTNSVITLRNPCLDNLDNDGNLLTDEADPACSFRITAITKQGSNISVRWQSVVGRTNYLQVCPGRAGGGYSTNFTDLTPQIIVTGIVVAVTNWVEIGGATNSPARYYRVRRQ